MVVDEVDMPLLMRKKGMTVKIDERFYDRMVSVVYEGVNTRISFD
jgi:hypothetical protein